MTSRQMDHQELVDALEDGLCLLPPSDTETGINSGEVIFKVFETSCLFPETIYKYWELIGKVIFITSATEECIDEDTDEKFEQRVYEFILLADSESQAEEILADFKGEFEKIQSEWVEE